MGAETRANTKRHREWFLKNRERVREYRRKWEAANKEKVAGYLKKYRQKNTTKYLKYQREYQRKYYAKMRLSETYRQTRKKYKLQFRHGKYAEAIKIALEIEQQLRRQK